MRKWNERCSMWSQSKKWFIRRRESRRWWEPDNRNVKFNLESIHCDIAEERARSKERKRKEGVRNEKVQI